MKKYIMALDQGTTSSRTIIYDKKGNIISVAQKEFTQYFPQEGWVEHDAMEIWATQIGTAHEALLEAGLTYKNIAAIGITNQRETTVVWNKNTGEPIYHAIVWQCRRTADYATKLKPYEAMIREKTGLLADPYFSGTKLAWILDNVEGAREAAENGDLLFGTIESWLIWKMTDGKVHVSDYSNACRTMLFNINTLEWDRELCDLLNIPMCMLPQPAECSAHYGDTAHEILGGPVPITGAAGDQQAALFGEACFNEGDVKSTYGTGNFLLLNTGEKPVMSGNGLLTTIAWGLDGKVFYALEGSVFVCGAAVQWLRDQMNFFKTAPESEGIARQVDDCGGVYVVPAFVGLGAPYWDPDARGSIFGITRGTRREHIVRATLASLAYQNQDLLSAMEADTGCKIDTLKVDGGAAMNNLLMQFQANISDIDIVRYSSIESTSLGAAYFAGLQIGYYESLEDIIESKEIAKKFTPSLDSETRKKKLEGWHKAVKATMSYHV
ncbi:MAG: glycerol kinase GlpK [Clostridiales bacterium]|nr:glycerol kinase GlpK [Clostridiales bacterium]